LACANENRDWRIYCDFTQVLVHQARNLRVDSISYDAEILNGNHINLYLSVEWDDSWNPAVGYGLVHQQNLKFYTENGKMTKIGGEPAEEGVVYGVDIMTIPEGLLWTQGSETLTVNIDYPDEVTRSLAIGGWESVVAFDNLVIEGQLARLA
jgi:hypothetical protein